jgi:preprotein translocase subunit SecF
MKLLRYKYIYFAISLIILIPGVISLVKNGLRLSIDFTGGTLLEITSEKVDKSVLEKYGAFAQKSSDNTYVLRMHEIDNAQKEKLLTEFGATEKRFETVGPVVGKELTQKAFMAMAVASLMIIAYIAWSFRHVPKPYSSWKFGVSAVIALLHDALVVVGIFSIFGALWHVEIDSLFVTAVLTVIGFSVHDTIVVFDRVRENLPKMPKNTFEEVVDFSLSETLVRSLNTSLTAILTLVALLLFGGESIRWFVAALLVGIISGTYSSIFNAAPILAIWESKPRAR